MILYVAQDYNGNVYITDVKDCLPPDVTDFHEVQLVNYARHVNEPYIQIEVADVSFAQDIIRKGVLL